MTIQDVLKVMKDAEASAERGPGHIKVTYTYPLKLTAANPGGYNQADCYRETTDALQVGVRTNNMKYAKDNFAATGQKVTKCPNGFNYPTNKDEQGYFWIKKSDGSYYVRAKFENIAPQYKQKSRYFINGQEVTYQDLVDAYNRGEFEKSALSQATDKDLFDRHVAVDRITDMQIVTKESLGEEVEELDMTKEVSGEYNFLNSEYFSGMAYEVENPDYEPEREGEDGYKESKTFYVVDVDKLDDNLRELFNRFEWWSASATTLKNAEKSPWEKKALHIYRADENNDYEVVAVVSGEHGAYAFRLNTNYAENEEDLELILNCSGAVFEGGDVITHKLVTNTGYDYKHFTTTGELANYMISVIKKDRGDEEFEKVEGDEEPVDEGMINLRKKIGEEFKNDLGITAENAEDMAYKLRRELGDSVFAGKIIEKLDTEILAQLLNTIADEEGIDSEIFDVSIPGFDWDIDDELGSTFFIK